MNTYLIIDVSYLMHRAFHAMGDLSFEGVGTGALFGFFREIEDLRDTLGDDYIAFACDHGHAYRTELYPGYKLKRYDDKTPEELEARQELRKQINALRDKWLPMAGYRNVYKQPGVEADDLIARAVEKIPNDAEAVIVSSDTDLWQLIRHNVWCYSPSSKKATTLASFTRDWGVPPAMWPHVKALAGCKTDEIEGIPGVGEKTAAAWYSNTLKACDGQPRRKFRKGVLVEEKPCPCKRCKISQGLSIHNLNIKLTRIPCPGVEPVIWREDEVTAERWNAVAERLGFRTLMKVGAKVTRG